MSEDVQKSLVGLGFVALICITIVVCQLIG